MRAYRDRNRLRFAAQTLRKLVGICAMKSYHAKTYRLLRSEPRLSVVAGLAVESTERRLRFRLPASVREWYCDEDAIDILAKFSNSDDPIALEKLRVTKWRGMRLLPFKNENQGLATWAIVLDGADDPPVLMDFDTDGAEWIPKAPTFSAYIRACVWDYVMVLNQPVLVQAQNGPLSAEAFGQLWKAFAEQPPTTGWPGDTQYRFEGKDCAILIWAEERGSDWFVGARDVESLEAVLRVIWHLDDVGQSLYDIEETGKAVLDRIRGAGGQDES